MVKNILKETKNKEVLAQAVVLANTLIVDTFDGKQFKSANWDKVKTLDKLEEWPFTVEINERRYPWGDTEVEVRFKHRHKGLTYIGIAVLDGSELKTLKSMI